MTSDIISLTDTQLTLSNYKVNLYIRTIRKKDWFSE